MEETNALLSSLVQTKLVGRELVSLASTLSQLIIVNEEYETGKRTTFPCDIRWSASIVKETEVFVAVARRLGDEADEELREKMPMACDMLSASAQNLVMAQQRLSLEKFSCTSRKNLIRATKDIIQRTIKVILLLDDAEVRSILRSVNCVTDRLGILTSVSSMKKLVPPFKSFVESVMILINLLKKRQSDLVQSRQREELLTHMATLRPLIPMLNSALQTYVKYGDNPQARASRDYVMGNVLDCLKEIGDLVRNPHSQDSDFPEEDDDQPGHFISTIDKIMDCLTKECRGEAVIDLGEQFDLLIETIVRHSMAVAHLSNAHHRSLIVTNSQRVMHQRSIISQLGQNHKENPAYEELADDFNSACNLLEQEVADLERHVNSAILRLVVESFSETTQPMERLVKAALKNITNRDVIPEDESEDLLEPYISSFHAHSDRMCQVSRFLAASSAESRRVRHIRSCIGLLEKLDPELVPATIACRSDMNNKAGIEHLRLLKREWCSTVNTLVNTIDDIVDSQDFIEISEHEIREAVNRCKTSLYSEATDVAEMTRLLIGLTSRVIHVVKTTVDKHDDALFRNGVMIHVSQLSKVVPAIKTSANRVLNDMGELRLHETLHRRGETALTTVNKVRRALRGEDCADPMNPARLQVREPDHLNALNAALAECEVDDLHIESSLKLTVTEEKLTTTVGMKKYIADLTDSRLAELARRLVAAAVSGNRKLVDVLSNDVLVRTNHVSELTRSVEQLATQHTETLSTCYLQLSQLTPKLIDLGLKTSLGDINHVEPLHQTAEEWAGTVTYIEGLLDGILNKWVEVSYKVVDAAKIGNIPLLTAQVQHLEEHRRHIVKLREMVSEGAAVESVVTQERLQTLHGHMDELESQTAMLATVADMLVTTNNDDEKAQLERTAREWAGLAFSTAALIDKLAEESLSQVKGEMTVPNWDDVTEVNVVIKRFTEDTIRVKDAVSKVSQWMQNADRRSQLEEMLGEIDLVVNRMSENCETLTSHHSPLQTADRLYAPLRIMLLQWLWAVKVQEMWLTIDDVTLEYSLQMEQLLVPRSVEVTVGMPQTGPTSPGPSQAVTDLKDRVSQTVAKLTQALTPLRDTPQRSSVQRDLKDLSKLTGSLVNTVESHMDTPTEQSQSEVRMLSRSWACTAQSLMYSLSDISAVESSVVQEANSLLKGPGKFVCSTPGDVTDQTPTSRPCGERTLRDVSNTPVGRPKTDVVKQESVLSTNISQDSRLKRPCRTGSGRKVTFDSSTYGERETQTVKAYISESDSATPDSYSTTSAAGAEVSYKSLKAGPRTLHRQPEPPSAKSGLRSVHAMSRSLDSSVIQWEDDNNAIVRVAKEMTQHLNYMAEFKRSNDGLPRSNVDLIKSAKSIAKNGESLVKFAKILAKYCVDKRLSNDLLFYADHVPMVATQLSMLASVKAASPEDTTTEKMLVQNAEKLLSAVSKMLTAAEAACVKGLRQPPSDALDETEAIVLATQWHHRFTRHRLIEKNNMSMDELGLRRVSQPRPAPTLTEMVAQK